LQTNGLDRQDRGRAHVLGVAPADHRLDRPPIGLQVVDPLRELLVRVAAQHVQGRVHVRVRIDHSKALSHRPLRGPDSTTAVLLGSRLVLGHPSFAFLFSSRVFANMGFHMLGVALGWQLYAITGSALDRGLVGLAQFLPIAFLTLLVGQVADRYDRRLIAVVCQLVEATAAVALVAATMRGWQSGASILAIVALIGAARAFESPATTALVSDGAPPPLIARPAAWLVSANQTAQIVGPALGGLLSTRGLEAAYLCASALFVLAGACAAV